MYAIIATGGKQYKVAEGDSIKIERLDAEVGSVVTFDQVLAVNRFFIGFSVFYALYEPFFTGFSAL